MFADVLKNLRKEYDYSQAYLAKLLNVTQQAVGMWEKSKNMPDIATILKLSRIFHVPVDYLLENTEDNAMPGQSPLFSPEALRMAEIYDTVSPNVQKRIKRYVEGEYEDWQQSCIEGIIEKTGRTS